MASNITGGRKFKGFTFIEIIVVLSVIGLLVALLLPAVQIARDASRKAQCANNLKQFGLALQAYEAAFQTFPPGRVGKGYSFHVMLLPFMEYRPIYGAFNFQLSSTEIDSSPNSTVANVKIDTFFCPSDIVSNVPGVSGTSYAGSRGVELRNFRDNGAFSFWAQRPTGFQGFSDGTGTTAAIAEWVRGPIQISIRDPKGTIFSTPDSLSGPANFDRFANECSNINVINSEINDNDKGRNWWIGGYATTLYNHTLSINDHSCRSEGFVQEGAYSSGSRHAQGANVLFADGHVRFVSDHLQLSVWRAFGTRNGGESIHSE